MSAFFRLDFCELRALTEHAGPGREQIGLSLGRWGVAGLSGLLSRDDVLAASRLLLSKLLPHPDSDSDGLTTLRGSETTASGPGRAGLGRDALTAHTERAQLAVPPRLVLLACIRPGRTGGHLLLTDGQAVLGELATFTPAALQALHSPRAAFFGGADGRFTPVFDLLPSGRWRIRLRQDELARFPPEAEAHLPALRSAITRHTIALRLAAGQAVIIDNYRVLHGRTAFTGERHVLRALGEPHEALGLADGLLDPRAHLRANTIATVPGGIPSASRRPPGEG